MSIAFEQMRRRLLSHIFSPAAEAWFERYKALRTMNERRRHWERTLLSHTDNKCFLTPEQKQEIDNFWKPYCKVSGIEHQFYAEKRSLGGGEAFSARYMPDSIYYTHIDPYFNNWEAAPILDNKCQYAKMLPQVPLPKHVAYRIGGFWQNADYQFISEETVINLVSLEDEVCVKVATCSEGGSGVHFCNIREDGVAKFQEIIQSIPGDIAIQCSLKQSSTLAKLNPSSVNTVRFISLLDKDGKVTIYSAILRMGMKDARVDNACSGGITCGIQEDGRLKNVAYSADGTVWREVHPGSGVRYSDIVIPHFEDAKNIVYSNHRFLPHFRLVSWDIAFDENDSPLLIEVNMRYGELDFHQLNNGPLFGDETEKILNEVFGSQGASRG